ncbi:formyltetrahydrofolate deformylase [Spongisporangium articulatum]|uniref:Formyltetrahydrofolate deformylase n=1 Tax=Spongisporangium articulatum TaxID=3362603 RepID=A0ABW8APD7_9ACTN
MTAEFVLTLSCPDRPGIVYAVTSYLVQHNCNILQSQQYGDLGPTGTDRFFMRVQFSTPDPVETHERLSRAFQAVADSFQMDWHLVDASARYRVLIMVSKFGHCLNDLLFRHRIGALDVDIPAVVSNHTDFADLVESQGIPFVHLPVTRDNKPQAEAQLLELVEKESVDLVVLARYMQVLSPQLCETLSGRVINIHHSFLPSFMGARPYQQAHARGVKLIGATAHYVTSDLDEGPIIEQDVERVDHTMSAEEMGAAGRDVECQVLARAVTWHTRNRVLMNGHRTVVFR